MRRRLDIDYLEVEEQIRLRYRQVTAKYRRDDEIEVTTENHRRLCQTLNSICRSFDRPIRVLDVGCGTGRYFHCLEKVEHLLGVDVSEEMLAAAQDPVCSEQVTARRIELRRANIYLAQFPAAAFDFIYSLGMFGHGCPVLPELGSRFYDWLAPGGVLFFNTVDFAGLPRCYRVRRRVKALLYPLLTRRWQKALDDRERQSPFFFLTKSQLAGILRQTPFREFEITSHPCRSPLGIGRHLECLARKTAGDRAGN